MGTILTHPPRFNKTFGVLKGSNLLCTCYLELLQEDPNSYSTLFLKNTERHVQCGAFEKVRVAFADTPLWLLALIF